MKVSVLFAIVAVLVCTISGAFASPATTSQTWTFATEAGSATPDSVNNVYGSPTALIAADEWGSGWYDTLPGVYGLAQGWWDIGSGSIVLTIPNRVTTDPKSYKDITVWVKYWLDLSAAPDVQVSPTASLTGSTSQKLANGPRGGAWWMDTLTFHIEPNPDFETITLWGNMMGSQIDEIRVDTVCEAVPEPGSLVALGSGLLAFAGFALRRNRA